MNQYSEDYSKRWQVLCAVMTGGFMVSVDGSVVNLILPHPGKSIDDGFYQGTMGGIVFFMYVFIVFRTDPGPENGIHPCKDNGYVHHVLDLCLAFFKGSMCRADKKYNNSPDFTDGTP